VAKYLATFQEWGWKTRGGIRVAIGQATPTFPHTTHPFPPLFLSSILPFVHNAHYFYRNKLLPLSLSLSTLKNQSWQVEPLFLRTTRKEDEREEISSLSLNFHLPPHHPSIPPLFLIPLSKIKAEFLPPNLHLAKTCSSVVAVDQLFFRKKNTRFP
jgi:hypothetical protein